MTASRPGSSPHGLWSSDVSMKDGLTSMSPMWLMITRWPVLQQQEH